MIPQIHIAEAFQSKKHVKNYQSFLSGVRFAEAELESKPTTSALDYLKTIGRKEIESINGMTGEFIITPDQLDEYAKQKSITFAEWCGINKYKIRYILTELGDKSHFWIKYYYPEKYTTSELYAKFEAERGDKSDQL